MPAQSNISGLSPRIAFHASTDEAAPFRGEVADSSFDHLTETYLAPDSDDVPKGIDGETSEHYSLLRKVGKSVGGLGVLGAAVGTYVFEQSPMNESIRGDWGVRALVNSHQLVDSIDSRVISTGAAAAAVALTVGGITMAVESASGMITAATVSRKEGMLGRFNGLITRLANKLETTDKNGKPKGDVTLALAGGAAPLVVKKHAESNGERSFGDNTKTALKGAAGIAAFSGALGAATAVAIETADIHGHPEVALQAIDVVSDPKTWWGLYGGIIFSGLIKKGANAASLRAGAWYHSRPAAVADALAFEQKIDINASTSGAR